MWFVETLLAVDAIGGALVFLLATGLVIGFQSPKFAGHMMTGLWSAVASGAAWAVVHRSIN